LLPLVSGCSFPYARALSCAQILKLADRGELSGLDIHPALGVLHDERFDASWRHAQITDIEIRAHAERYLEYLEAEEIERRVAAAPSDAGECPVCGNESVVGVAVDDYGMGVIQGMCFVCSYERSARITDSEAQDLVWVRHWKDD
jgi:hypothetical protein